MATSARHSGQPSPKKGTPRLPQCKHDSRVPPNQVFAPAVIASVLERTHGMIAIAARVLHCSRQTIYNAVHAYPEVKTVLEDAREQLLDRAELALLRAIDKGQAWAVCFYLKTQGRKRGYVEKVDVSADSATLEELVLLSQKRQAERQLKDTGEST